MIREEPDTVYFTVDIGMWAIRDILEEFPDRAMNVGIYEDAMVSIAAGMAYRGLIPTVFGIQPYLIERTLEQIKMDLVYQKSGVNIIGTGAAIDYSKYGYSHYCPEDAALIKMFPGAEFIAPGTAKQFLQLFDAAYRNGHPSFFRISDHPNSKYNCDVIFGQAEIIQRGTKATIIAVSILLDMVMAACAGEDVTVLYYTTLEPFDGATLAENCSSGKVLVCEPHFSGTLDHDILEALKDRTIQIAHVGFPREIFRNYGTYEEKNLYYGLTAENVKTKIKILLSQ
jgi:transketolase